MQSNSPENSCPPQPATAAPQGMKCPVCSQFIPVTIYQLLHEGSVACPNCGLVLTINKPHSQKALDALKKVEEATEKLRQTEKFKR